MTPTNQANSRTNKKNAGNWQGKKSHLTRTVILDATITCFIEFGYTRTTMSRIAAMAGLSPGAMTYHFSSRDEIIKAAAVQLQQRRLEELKQLLADQSARFVDSTSNIDISNDNVSASGKGLMTKKVWRRGIYAYWEYFNLPSHTAYHELTVAARSDAELAALLKPVHKTFETRMSRTFDVLFPTPSERAAKARELISDLLYCNLQGLSVSYLQPYNKQRVKILLDHLADDTFRIYEDVYAGK